MPIVKCGVCNKSFYVKQCYQKLGWGKYCSISCRSKSQLKGMDVICEVCGKKVQKVVISFVQKNAKLFGEIDILLGRNMQTG